MALFTIYSSGSDHYVISQSSIYAEARTGGGMSDDPSNDTSRFGQQFSTPNYFCSETFLSFNTSVVPAGTPSSNVTLTIKVSSAPTTSFTMKVGEQAWSGGTGDFVSGAAMGSIPAFGSATISATGTVTVTGPSNIARTADYDIMLWSARHEAGTVPTGNERANIYNCRRAGTAEDPYLTMNVPVAYSMAAGVGSFTLTGYDVKHLRVVAEAASFALTGIDTPLRYGRKMSVDAGAFTLSFNDAAFAVLRDPPQGRTIIFERSSLDDTRTLTL